MALHPEVLDGLMVRSGHQAVLAVVAAAAEAGKAEAVAAEAGKVEEVMVAAEAGKAAAVVGINEIYN